MLDFAVAQIRVLFLDIHSQAAATSHSSFVHYRAPEAGWCTQTYLKHSGSPGGQQAPQYPEEEKDVMCLEALPSAGWTRILRGEQDLARAAQRISAVEQMQCLTNHSRNPGSHLHPVPTPDFCATLCTLTLQSPNNPDNTGERHRSVFFQAGWAKMVVLEKITFWEASTAPGFPAVLCPAGTRSRA